NQVARALGYVLVQIVHQHAHRGFLLPAFAGERGDAWGADAGVGGCRNFGVNRHVRYRSSSGAESSIGSEPSPAIWCRPYCGCFWGTPLPPPFYFITPCLRLFFHNTK